jgi:hypothetical protein
MKARAFTPIALLLAACSSQEGILVEIVTEEWLATPDLPPPELESVLCADLFDLQVIRPATLDEYHTLCPMRSWACQTWHPYPEQPERYQPVAILNPELPDASVDRTIVHEYLHAVQWCAGFPVDYDHADPLVWDHNQGSSVEERAQARLPPSPVQPVDPTWTDSPD